MKLTRRMWTMAGSNRLQLIFSMRDGIHGLNLRRK
jgi:hypothetical protein